MSAATKLRVSHIATEVLTNYAPHLDLSDVANAGPQQLEMAKKTRGLAAFALASVVGNIDAATAAAHVTDGSDDNGIDALYVDPIEKRIYLVQAKWSEAGTGSIGLGDMRNTIAGMRDITEERFDRFNAKIQPMVPSIEAALGDAHVSFSLIVATTGASTLASRVQTALDDAKSEMNDISEMLTDQVLGLAELHEIVREGGRPAKIDLDVTLEEWGTVTEPFGAFYGLIEGAVLANWYQQHGGRLFDDNLRKALGSTHVNAGIVETVESAPERFWYYNNGVTALCDSVQKLPRGGNSRTSGDFVVKGLSVVNGAQTVSSLASKSHDEGVDLSAVRVWIRLISLDRCPEGFATEVTRTTNTQNTVEGRDFLSLDATQQRLQDDMRLSLAKRYVFKRGESPPSAADGCSVTEAIVALACANPDVNFAVLAKSAVGRLEDGRGRFYPQMFNDGTSAFEVWQSVQVYRAVEAKLASLRQSSQGKRKAVAQQGNRMITHMVLQGISKVHDLKTDLPLSTWTAIMADVPAQTEQALDSLRSHVESNYAANYVTSLFKNAGRCAAIARALV